MEVQITATEVKTTAAVFVSTLVAVKLFSYLNQKRYKLPPGPRGVPILGYLPFFGDKPPVTFNELRRTYGDVISVTMGSFSAIVVSGRDTIKEALITKGDDFSGRPAFSTAKLFNEGRNFAFATYGALWKVHRRLVMNVLHAFSNARNNPIEDIIRSEANTVADELLAHGNKGFRPTEHCFTASSSMIYQLLYGRHRNIREDKDFQGIMEDATRFRTFNRLGNVFNVMPWLRFIMPWKLLALANAIQKFFNRRTRKVAEHEASYDKNDLRDITDGLINAANNLSEEATSLGLDKRRVMESLDVLFGAATGTVGSSLDWLLLLMAAYPDVQDKLAKEIEKVVGGGRQPTLADRHNLHYVEATIHEMFRFASPVPTALPHATVRDTTLNGYDIPEGTVVLINLYSINRDKELWGDPDTFRPERFLDEAGQLDRDKVDLLAPFSLGRRRCAGENLARMELSLFFATLMQRVKFYKPQGAPEYSMEGIFTFGRDTEPYEVCVSARE